MPAGGDTEDSSSKEELETESDATMQGRTESDYKSPTRKSETRSLVLRRDRPQYIGSPGTVWMYEDGRVQQVIDALYSLEVRPKPVEQVDPREAQAVPPGDSDTRLHQNAGSGVEQEETRDEGQEEERSATSH